MPPFKNPTPEELQSKLANADGEIGIGDNIEGRLGKECGKKGGKASDAEKGDTPAHSDKSSGDT